MSLEERLNYLYKKIIKKVDEFDILLFQYNTEEKFDLQKVLGLDSTVELEKNIVVLNIDRELKVSLNLYLLAYSRLSERDKKKFKYQMYKIIYSFYELFYKVNLMEIKLIIDLLLTFEINYFNNIINKIKDVKPYRILKLIDEKYELYEIMLYEDGAKIYKNNKFIKGYFEWVSVKYR